MGIHFFAVQFIDQHAHNDGLYLRDMMEPAVLSVLPHIPLHVWPMAQIVIGSHLQYVAAQTSFMSDLGLMLKHVLPYCDVFDFLVETTTGVYFVGSRIS